MGMNRVPAADTSTAAERLGAHACAKPQSLLLGFLIDRLAVMLAGSQSGASSVTHLRHGDECSAFGDDRFTEHGLDVFVRRKPPRND